MKTQSPFISVVIPAYNAQQTVDTCLAALSNQTYENYESILVDNGSSDDTVSIASNYEDVIVVHERETEGSYAARNTGVEVTEGEIIAFLDADCNPSVDWLEQGLQRLQTDDADLVGGNVVFTYTDPNDPAEVFDSITNMQIEQNVENRQVAKTANLFVRRKVLQEVGPFPNQLESGGDVYWTEKATQAGYRLSYAPDATVEHPARSFKELRTKQRRVGRGQLQLRDLDGWSWPKRLRVGAWIASGFLPKPPHYLSQELSDANLSVSYSLFVQILFVAWVCRITETVGRIEYVVTEIV